MKILAVEFSPPQRSVAVVPAGASGIPPVVSEVVETGPGWIRAVELVDEALRQAKLEREQIDCLAIGLGPGSYTGIRAAIALAQGWQLARGVKLLGVSSAECLAAQAQAEGLAGRVNVVIDAQRNEFYLARYEITQNVVARSVEPAGLGVPPSGGPDRLKPECQTVGSGREWREVEPLRLATMAEVQERERAGELLVGPEVTRWFPSGRIVFPHAAMLGQMAASRSDFIAGEKLEPIYLRETTFVKAPPPRVVPL